MAQFSDFVDGDFFVHRLKELYESLNNTTNETLYNHKKQIIQRVEDVISTSEDTNKACEKIFSEYDLFCSVFVDGKEAPMIPTPWQCKAAQTIEDNIRTYIPCARRVGKSLFASSFIVWECVSKTNKHHVIFAPTKNQLFVMEDVVRIVRSSPLLKGMFRTKDGKDAETEQTFAATDCTIKGVNVGLHTNFDYKRGQGGNRIWVDEFQLLSEDANRELVDRLMNETIAGTQMKKLIKLGTLSVRHNPNVKPEIERVRDNPDRYGYISVDCWDALRQGIKSTDSLKSVAYEENIPCEYLQEYGVCPEFVPEYFENPPENPHGDGECPVWKNDIFLMEEMAEFPRNEDRFFPPYMIDKSKMRHGFIELAEVLSTTNNYYMSVDIGLMAHPSVVLIGHVVPRPEKPPILKVDYYEEIPPFDPSEQLDGTSSRHINRIKKLFHVFKPRKIFVDATRAADTVQLLTSGKDSIPKARFYADETMKKKNFVGVWWSSKRKTDMYLAYKRFIDQSRIKVPGPDTEVWFWNTWWNDHFGVEAEPTKDLTNLKFNRTGHLIDAAVMLSLCLEKANATKAATTVLTYEF